MKQICTSYSVTGQNVTMNGVNVPLNQILLISDATTGGVLYSLTNGNAASYSQGTNSVLTLKSGVVVGSSDKLTIYYDDGLATNAPTNVSVSNFPATQTVAGSVSVSNFPASTEISNDAGNPIPVSGTFYQATQPVSLTSLPSLATGSNTIGSVNVLGGNATAVKVDGSAVTQPISVSSLPLPTNAAQDGVDGTGITAPTGGSGIRGWLSGIYNKLSNSLTVTASNLDVAVSTRLKPADTLAGVTAVGSITNALPTGTNSIGQVTANAGTNLNTSNLDVALSTRLKPADTLAGVTAVGSITNALPAGTNSIGQVTANAGTNLNTSSLALESGGNLATIATNTGKIPSKGTATIANSTPVNIASDQTVPVSIADGSDSAEGSKADSAANNSTSSWSVIALLKGLYAALTGTPSVGAVSATNTVSTTGIVPNAGNLLVTSTDVSAYRSVTIQTTPSGGVAGAFQAQVSSDGTNWVYISGQSSAPSSSGSTTSAYVSGAVNNYLLASTTFSTFSLTGAKFFRVYVTGGNGTGTVNTTAFFSSLPVQPTLVQDSSNNLLVAGTVTANPSPATTYSYTNTGAVSSGAVLIGPITCSAFKELTLQVTAIGTGGNGMQVQVSNDNSNWVSCAQNSPASSTGAGTATQGSGSIYCYPTYGSQYIRVINGNAVTAGTTTAYAQLSQIPTTRTTVGLSTNTPTPTPLVTAGFATYFTLVSASGTNATSVKASAGTIGTCVLTNTTLSIKYVKLFNKASAPTMGTDTPVIQFPISANSTLDVSSAFAGLRLSTGIALATTGGSALLDNTSVAAGDVLVNMTYV